jgi:cell division protein FtsB
MKRLIIALTLLTFLAAVPFAFARGNRFVLDQKWKQEQASQKQQARQFKAIEAEAKALLGEVKAGEDRKMTRQPQDRTDYDAPGLWEPAP